MIIISEKDYRQIKLLQEDFYYGVDKYCDRLDDTSRFRDPFEEIMEIIDNARSDKQYENYTSLFNRQ